MNVAVWAPLCCTPDIGATNGANVAQPRPGFGRRLRGPRGLRNARAVSGRCVGVQGSGRARLGGDLAALPALQTPIFGRNRGTGMGQRSAAAPPATHERGSETTTRAQRARRGRAGAGDGCLRGAGRSGPAERAAVRE